MTDMNFLETNSGIQQLRDELRNCEDHLKRAKQHEDGVQQQLCQLMRKRKTIEQEWQTKYQALQEVYVTLPHDQPSLNTNNQHQNSGFQPIDLTQEDLEARVQPASNESVLTINLDTLQSQLPNSKRQKPETHPSSSVVIATHTSAINVSNVEEQKQSVRRHYEQQQLRQLSALPVCNTFFTNFPIYNNQFIHNAQTYHASANEELYLEAPLIVYIDRSMKDPTKTTKTGIRHKTENQQYFQRFVGASSQMQTRKSSVKENWDENCNIYSLFNSLGASRSYRFYPKTKDTRKSIKYRFFFALQSLSDQPNAMKENDKSPSNRLIDQNAFFLGAVVLNDEYENAPNFTDLPNFLHPQLYISESGQCEIKLDNLPLDTPAFTEDEKRLILIYWLLHEWQAGRKVLYRTLSSAIRTYCAEPTRDRKNTKEYSSSSGLIFESTWGMNVKNDAYFQNTPLKFLLHNPAVNPGKVVRACKLLEPCLRLGKLMPHFHHQTIEWQELTQKVDEIRLLKRIQPAEFQKLLVNNWNESHVQTTVTRRLIEPFQ